MRRGEHIREIDFSRIAQDALGRAGYLVPLWVPGGKLRHGSQEYLALNPTRYDKGTGSFCVNLRTGKWGDFATDDCGKDLISLYGYVHGIGNKEAALAVAGELGIDPYLAASPSAFEKQDVKQAVRETGRGRWVPLIPAPLEAGDIPLAHPVRGRYQRAHRYLDVNGRLIGAVCRFVTSTGGKDDIPLCYAKNDQSGKMEWRWLSFPEPRPLYGLDRLSAAPKSKPVLILEGEKCADAAQDVIGSQYVCMAWPGGCKAVHKADWSPLAGRTVYFWPDQDAKREPLSRTEKAAGTDAASKPLLPRDKQPGIKAMADAAKILATADPDARLLMVQVPDPNPELDGWDIADEIKAGASEADLLARVGEARLIGQIGQADAISDGNGEIYTSVIQRLTNRFALIYSTETVYDIDTNLVMTIGAMKLAFGSEQVGRWLGHDKRQMVRPDQLVFDPSEQVQPPCINMYRGISMQAQAGDCAPILALLHHLCAESAKDAQEVDKLVRWVLRWIALPLQRPGTKMRSALVFHGPQGAGKNLFFEIVAKIYGQYAIVVGQEQLEEKHNDWCSGKLFMIGDEVIARQELFTQKNKLKSFITGETIQINPKFLPIRTEKNHINVVFLSNEDQPLALEESDRRYFVVYTPPSRNDDLYDRVARCLNDGGAEAFYDYLLSMPLGDFSAFDKPPMTLAKRELIDLGMKPEHRFVYEWMSGYLPVHFAPCTSGQLFRLFELWARFNGERIAPQNKFTSSVCKFINLLSHKAGHEVPFMARKMVKVENCYNGQKCERVWIPKTFAKPEGSTEGEWISAQINKFDTYINEYRELRSHAA